MSVQAPGDARPDQGEGIPARRPAPPRQDDRRDLPPAAPQTPYLQALRILNRTVWAPAAARWGDPVAHADHRTSVADARAALCLACGVWLAHIDPSGGFNRTPGEPSWPPTPRGAGQ